MAQTVKLKNRSGTSQTYSGISTLKVKNSNNQYVSFTLEDDLFSELSTDVYGSIADTIWEWNTALTFDGLEQGDEFSVRFLTNGETCFQIKTNKASGTMIYNMAGTEITVYEGGSWANSAYREMDFFPMGVNQGADATNARFINWLEANGREIGG